jgi:hypothetical protein
VTWQPGPADGAAARPPGWPFPDAVGAGLPAGAVVPAAPPPTRRRRGVRWVAMVMLLVMGLCGLAAAAVGAAGQLLPRQFTVTQQRQIMTWEMTRRWRELPAGSIFPTIIGYELGPAEVQGGAILTLQATRLAIADQSACAAAVSAAAAKVLAAQHCTAALRATYLDASGSMIATVAVAVLPDSSAAATAAHELRAAPAVRVLPVAGTPAAGFRDRQRQLSYAMSAGPYVLMSAAGFTDGRRAVPLARDAYYEQEMTSLTQSLAEAVGRNIGVQPAVPRCPGSPGC